jgi:hypothetical protein
LDHFEIVIDENPEEYLSLFFEVITFGRPLISVNITSSPK